MSMSGEGDTDDASTEEEISDKGDDPEGEDSAHSDESFERIDKSDLPDDLTEAEAAPSLEASAEKSDADMSQDVSSSTPSGAN